MTHPNSAEAKQINVDKNPFEGLRITNSSILNTLEGRHPCPECGKSRKYFCYTCYVPIKELEGKLPKVKLPIQIDIIKHQREIDGKSTAAHAALLAPDQVKVYSYPDIPNYDVNKTVLIYPSFNSVRVGELFHNPFLKEKQEIVDCPHTGTLLKHMKSSLRLNGFSRRKNLPIERAVFIDSTWNQSKGIFKDKNIRRIPTVVIQNRISQFWRHQKGSPRWYLATIEAIHQFLLELHINAWGLNKRYKGVEKCFTEDGVNFYKEMIVEGENEEEGYDGQYDDLLYFFRHMYDLIHDYYDHEELYAYKRRLL